MSQNLIDKFLKELAGGLSNQKNLSTSPRDLKQRSKDLSYHEPREPICVVSASEEQDVVHTVKTCYKYSIPVIPFAAGTSLEGQVIPLKEVESLHQNIRSVVLDTSNMDKILDINTQDLDATIQPGVGWMDLNRELAKLGYMFPPDPGAAACVGGLCGTNASGTLAWRYGGTWANIRSLRVVLSDGTVINTRSRAPKTSAGYNLTNLIIGSEGTLAIIVQITVKLVHMPKISGAAMLSFPTLTDAAKAAHALVLSGVKLQRLELMDAPAVKSVNIAYSEKFPENAILLLDYAGDRKEEIEWQQETVLKLIKDGTLKCTNIQYEFDPVKAEKIWSVRKRAFFASKSLAWPELSNLKKDIMTTDVAVPISKLPEIMKFTEDLRDEYGLIAPMVAHAGDGNFHAMVILPSDPTHPSYKLTLDKAELFRQRMASRAIKLGGTCTGEHGVGVGKRSLLVEELGPDCIHVMRKIKGAMDPKGILNPGKVFEMVPVAKL